MERKRYLENLIQSIVKRKNNEDLIHLCHFAYDHSKHKLLLELKVIEILHKFLLDPDPKTKEISLGGLCNLSSNSMTHSFLDFELIKGQWEAVSYHGQRSISCILYFAGHKEQNLQSSDIVANNILISLNSK